MVVCARPRPDSKLEPTPPASAATVTPANPSRWPANLEIGEIRSTARGPGARAG